jgi:hypothetical protein
MRVGLRAVQASLTGLFHETRLFRVYSSTVVPGLLQTEGYALGVLRIAAAFHDLPTDDLAEAAKARIDRSRIIHGPGRVCCESAGHSHSLMAATSTVAS